MKVKKGKLVWLVISILVILLIIGVDIYKLINSSFETLDLIMDVLMIFVMTSNVFAFLEKKDK